MRKGVCGGPHDGLQAVTSGEREGASSARADGVSTGTTASIRSRTRAWVARASLQRPAAGEGHHAVHAGGLEEAAGQAQVLQGDRLFSGMYLNELLVRLLHRHDPHPTLFAAYSAALQSLVAEADVEVSLRRFELRLLEELGYSFDLAAEGDTGEAVQEDRWYQYHSHCGLVAGDGIAEPSTPAFSGSDLLRMARGQFGGEVRQTAKRLLRLALSEHLGGAPLRSRELFSHGASPSTGGDRDISGH